MVISMADCIYFAFYCSFCYMLRRSSATRRKMKYYILFNTFLVVLGVFLPWIHPGLFVVGLRGIDTMDGKIVLTLAFIGFLMISYELITRRGQFYWLYGGIGFAVLIVTSMVLYNYFQNNYSSGPGIYLSFLGGLQLTGSYVVFLFKHGRRLPPPT